MHDVKWYCTTFVYDPHSLNPIGMQHATIRGYTYRSDSTVLLRNARFRDVFMATMSEAEAVFAAMNVAIGDLPGPPMQLFKVLSSMPDFITERILRSPRGK